MAADRAELGVTNVPVRMAWEQLQANEAAQLVDVRTAAEWNFVGIPDLSSVGRQAILVEWLTYPDNRLNTEFVAQCHAQLAVTGAGNDTPVYFLCRSGSRSHSAAMAMQATGYSLCYNLAEGFEGPLDARQHRAVKGWKVAGLPWMQG